MKKKTQEFLEAHKSETPSKWREEAEWRRDNWSWLRHSQKIAVKVLLQMKQEGLTQKALAERMDCTQQYVSKILKGKENMSLDTLTKLEDALSINQINDVCVVLQRWFIGSLVQIRFHFCTNLHYNSQKSGTRR